MVSPTPKCHETHWCAAGTGRLWSKYRACPTLASDASKPTCAANILALEPQIVAMACGRLQDWSLDCWFAPFASWEGLRLCKSQLGQSMISISISIYIYINVATTVPRQMSGHPFGILDKPMQGWSQDQYTWDRACHAPLEREKTLCEPRVRSFVISCFPKLLWVPKLSGVDGVVDGIRQQSEAVSYAPGDLQKRLASGEEADAGLAQSWEPRSPDLQVRQGMTRASMFPRHS